jgi:hypothetical protein
MAPGAASAAGAISMPSAGAAPKAPIAKRTFFTTDPSFLRCEPGAVASATILTVQRGTTGALAGQPRGRQMASAGRDLISGTCLRELGKPDDEAISLEGIGECLLAEGSPGEGTARLRQALEIFQRLGMTLDAERVHTRIASLAAQ